MPAPSKYKYSDSNCLKHAISDLTVQENDFNSLPKHIHHHIRNAADGEIFTIYPTLSKNANRAFLESSKPLTKSPPYELSDEQLGQIEVKQVALTCYNANLAHVLDLVVYIFAPTDKIPLAKLKTVKFLLAHNATYLSFSRNQLMLLGITEKCFRPSFRSHVAQSSDTFSRIMKRSNMHLHFSM